MAKDKSLGMDGKPKFFFNEEKAKAFVERKGLGETHCAKDNGEGKWEILPKENGNESND